MLDLAFKSAIEPVASILNKENDSLELLEYYLDRVKNLNSKLNAIIVLDEQKPWHCARDADEALAKGEIRDPFQGVPMTKTII